MHPASAPDLPWDQPDWEEETSAWIESELSRLGRRPTGPVETLHRRPWSAMRRVATRTGPVYFKAPALRLRFEARLTEALAERHPDLVVRPLAIDPARGWMLSPDIGATLRTRIQSPPDLASWQPILRSYARLQRESAGRGPEFLALGVPDRRLAGLPDLFDSLLADHDSLRLGRPGGLSVEEHRRLRDLRRRLADDCARLGSLEIPESLAHEEIHDANVLAGADRPAILDWGDSSLGHPFTSILVMLRHPAYRFGLEESEPVVQALGDAYLEGFTDLAPLPRLRQIAGDVYRLAMVVRSLAYREVLAPLPERFRIKHDQIVGWLQEYLAAEARRAD